MVGSFRRRETYERWVRASRNDKVHMLDELIGSDYAVSAIELFSEKYQDPESQMEMAALFTQTALFRGGGTPSKATTVASYYYCVSGGGIESSMVSLAGLVGAERHSFIITEGDCGTDEDRSGIAGLSLASCRREGESRFEALARILRESNVDVLIYHAWFDPALLWDVVLCRLLGVKTILNVHGVFSHFLSVTDGSFSTWNDGRFFSLVPRVVRLCDAVVGQSAVNKRFFRRFNQRAYEIRNALPNKLYDHARRLSVDLSQGAATSTLIGRSDDVILWVGRFDVYKHPEDAVRILASIRESYPAAQLVMVGESGYETYERELEDLAASLGVSSFVSFEGFQEDVNSYYENATILLLTSEIEGYCMVLAEACAHGLPIVAYDLPYLPFAQCEGIIWVPQGDVNQAVREASFLLGDPAARGRFGEASLRYITSGTSVQSEDGWEDVFRDICEGVDVGSSDADDQEDVMWETLFQHYVRGADRTHAAIALRDAEITELRSSLQEKEAALVACRQEYERSYSYRIGRALLTVPRLLARVFRHG